MNLIDKRIVITRPRRQAQGFADALIAQGAIPIFLPVIEIIPPSDSSELDEALQNLDQYDWLVLTSIHAVEAVFQRLETLGIKKMPASVHVAAVGSKTAKAFSAHGVTPDHVPSEYISEGLFSGLNENISGRRFLLPQSNLAEQALAVEIRRGGGLVHDVIAYQNVIVKPDPAGLRALRSGVDVITFTSPSTVRNFIQLVRENGLDPFHLPGTPLFACIGPVTKRAAEEAGLGNLVMANEYTTNGLVERISELVHS